MQLSMDLCQEIEDRAIAAFCKRPEGVMNQPSEGFITDCGKFVEVRNRRGVLATYSVKHLPGGKFRLSYVEAN